MPRIICRFCLEITQKKPSQIVKGAAYCSWRCYWDSRARERAKTIPDGMKKCGRCLSVKQLTDFYTHGSKTGRAGWCKTCRCNDERKRRADLSLVRKFHQRYETDMAFRARELLRAIGKRCRSNALAFDLDAEWLTTRLEAGVCELSGLPFDVSVSTRRPNPYTPSVDRIHASKGYTKDNCRIVLLTVNIAMQHWGLDRVLPILRGLVAAQEKSRVA